ncbi:ADP-ribosylglycohydrolase family protein [Pendulispora albinea]|uniref:ADP-ribosylglycohydrolase family protein n=1 Tax=Pendulispora albinea TaxID=2741071 RepID=A0ABZ2LU43_9BACT
MDLFRQDRLAGTLLGAAVNDASGVAAAHAGLVANALSRARLHDGGDGAGADQVASTFRRALIGWALRHPWAADADTLHACGCIALGLRRTGTSAPTSGAAMRAAIIGAAFPFDVNRRCAVGHAVAEVTHTDPRSIDAALFVAEVAAGCVLSPANGDREALADRARGMVRAPELVVALHYALELVEKKVTMGLAARELGVSNDATSAVPLAAFAFVRYGDTPRTAMEQLDTVVGVHARAPRAILGSWMGTLLGGACLPWNQVARLRDGHFGPTHLRTLAADLSEHVPAALLVQELAGSDPPVPGSSAPVSSSSAPAPSSSAPSARRPLPGLARTTSRILPAGDALLAGGASHKAAKH